MDNTILRLSRACILLGLAALGALSAMAQENPVASLEDIDELPFFDTAVGFSQVTDVTVYQSFDPTREIFYLLPTTIAVDSPTYRYTNIRGRYEGRLDANITLTVPQTNSVEIVRQDILNRFANAEFRVVQPKEARFYFTAWGEKTRVNSFGASVRPYTTVPISVELGEPLSRVLLRQLSSAANIFSVAMIYTATGVVLNSDGSPRVGERTFTLGRTMGFSCGSSPERVVNTVSGETGCILRDSLTGEKVRRIQELLRVMGYYQLPVDGVVGHFTKSGIEKFQLDQGLEPLGIADSNLLSLLTRRYCEKKDKFEATNSDIVGVEAICGA
ncbi:peptidoglycan-binding domain-containing protein [Pseudooceanicola nanhaiensis]|uniref:peptidoglycan-binding domain-containing protein n=1 Tax=Pseudooceanicola nanhaiensis TaxID=375761 RepID=UPI00405954B2